MYIHTGFIGIWQPEAGLNKHTHINTQKILGLRLGRGHPSPYPSILPPPELAMRPPRIPVRYTPMRRPIQCQSFALCVICHAHEYEV